MIGYACPPSKMETSGQHAEATDCCQSDSFPAPELDDRVELEMTDSCGNRSYMAMSLDAYLDAFGMKVERKKKNRSMSWGGPFGKRNGGKR
jgi:hypothetical protein